MVDFHRLIRLLAYFIIGVLLSVWAVFSHAETIAATPVPPALTSGWLDMNGGGQYINNWYSSGAAACSASASRMSAWGRVGAVTTTYASYPGQVFCYNPAWGPDYRGFAVPTGQSCNGEGAEQKTSLAQCATQYTCPTGQNWTKTGSGASTTCVRPDCRADQTRDSGGVCQCPTGKTDLQGMCVTLCPGGYHTKLPDNGQCEKDCIGDQHEDSSRVCVCDPGKKSYFRGDQNQTAAYQGAGDCSAGCQVKASFFSLPLGVIGVAQTGSAGQWLTGGTTTGATCSGMTTTTGVVKATLPPPSPIPAPTPEQPADPKATPDNNKDPESCSSSGGVYMTVNGSGKCASPTPDNKTDAPKLTTGTKTTTTTNPDGSTTETTVKTITVTNPVTGEQSTSTSTTKVTKAPGGGVTGTTTENSTGTGDQGGKGSGGGGGGSGDGTKGFCLENPNSIICKNSSWTGNCEAPPVCDGDAVMCATAKAVWEHRCVNKWAEKDNDLSAGVDQTKLFGDADKATAALNNDGSKDFDVMQKFNEYKQTYLTYSSSCTPNLSFEFKGTTYQFDTSIFCTLGMVVKLLLHLAAYMTLIRVFATKLV